jgi:hypothetical protein
MGDIGPIRRIIEIPEPVEEPQTEPVETPEPVKVPEEVPA